MRDEKEANEEQGLRDLLPRRSSIAKGHNKKNSMQSLLIESLKFLNDDTDVVPQKRDPLLDRDTIKTNPPSEALNYATPA